MTTDQYRLLAIQFAKELQRAGVAVWHTGEDSVDVCTYCDRNLSVADHKPDCAIGEAKAFLRAERVA